MANKFIPKDHPALTMALEELEKISGNREYQNIYEMRMKAEMDHASLLGGAGSILGIPSSITNTGIAAINGDRSSLLNGLGNQLGVSPSLTNIGQNILSGNNTGVLAGLGNALGVSPSISNLGTSILSGDRTDIMNSIGATVGVPNFLEIQNQIAGGELNSIIGQVQTAGILPVNTNQITQVANTTLNQTANGIGLGILPNLSGNPATTANELAAMVSDPRQTITNAFSENPIATAATATGTAVGLLGLAGITLGRRREEEEEDIEGEEDTDETLESPDTLDSERLDTTNEKNSEPESEYSDGLEGSEEYTNFRGDEFEEEIIKEEPIISLSANYGNISQLDDSYKDNEYGEVPADPVFVTNSEILEQYYFATTKEKAAEMLAILCKKDPANTTKYYDALAGAVKKWEETPPSQRIKKFEKPAEKWVEDNIRTTKDGKDFTYPKNDQNEPDPQMLLEKIAVPKVTSLLDRQKSIVMNYYASMGESETLKLIAKMGKDNPDLKKSLLDAMDSIKNIQKENSSIPNFTSVLKEVGKLGTGISPSQIKELPQDKQEGKKAEVMENLITMAETPWLGINYHVEYGSDPDPKKKTNEAIFNPKEIDLEAKRAEVERRKQEGGLMPMVTLSSVKVGVTDENSPKGIIKYKIGSSELKSYQQTMADNFNKMTDSYWFEVDEDGNLTYQKLDGVKETKISSEKLIQETFINRKEPLNFYNVKKTDNAFTTQVKDSYSSKGSYITFNPSFKRDSVKVAEKEFIQNGEIVDSSKVKENYTFQPYVVLGHEMVHSLRQLNGGQLGNQNLKEAINNTISPLLELKIFNSRKDELINGVSLTKEEEKFYQLIKSSVEEKHKNNKDYNFDENFGNKFEVIIDFYQKQILRKLDIKADLNENYLLCEEFDPIDKKVKMIPMFKDEVLTTFDVSETKITKFNGDKLDSGMYNQISENSLRKDFGLPNRVNYPFTDSNLQILQKLQNVERDISDFREKYNFAFSKEKINFPDSFNDNLLKSKENYSEALKKILDQYIKANKYFLIDTIEYFDD